MLSGFGDTFIHEGMKECAADEKYAPSYPHRSRDKNKIYISSLPFFSVHSGRQNKQQQNKNKRTITRPR